MKNRFKKELKPRATLSAMMCLEPRAYLTTFSVRDYGALGNGVTDDRPAIQAALNAAQTNDSILLPGGEFLISGTLLVTKGIKLIGSGRTSRLRAIGAGFNLLYTTANNVQLSDIAFEGAATSDATEQFGIFTDPGSTASAVRVIGCYFTGPDGSASMGLNNGIKLDAASDGWTISGCQFERLIGTISGTGYGVLLGASSAHTITGNVFHGAAGQGRHAIYLAAGASNTLVEGNSIDHFNSSSIALYSKIYQTAVSGNTVRGNEILDQSPGDNGTAGIELAGKVSNNTIDANIITRPGRHGIIVGDAAQGGFATDNIISGNQISYAGQFGIFIEGAIRTSVVGNTVNDASLEVAGGYSAIHINSFYYSDPPVVAVGNMVRDNLLRGIGSAAAHYRYGIWINPSVPTPTDTSLLNNRISPGVFGAIEIAADSLPSTTTSGNTVLSSTFQADANLDGKVNTVDFNLLAANFGKHGIFWSGGDFDYDGDVDSMDFSILAGTFGARSAAFEGIRRALSG